MSQAVEKFPDNLAAKTVPSVTENHLHWSNTRRTLVGLVVVAIAGISYGIQGVLGKYAYEGKANVQTLLTIRFIMAGAVVWGLIAVLRARGKRVQLKQPRPKAIGFALLGVVWVSNSLFYFMGLELLPASTSALLVYVYPAMVVLWSTMFFGESLTWFKTGALVLALTGCFLTVDPAKAFGPGATFSWLGALLVLGSAFSNSWYAVLASVIGKGSSGLVMSAYGTPVTAACFLAYVTVTGSFNFGMTGSGWLICIIIGALTGVSIYLILVGISFIGPSRAAIVATSEPATSVFLGAILLAEPLTETKLLGGIFIIIAILTLSRSNK